MLVLSRKEGEQLLIGDNIVLTVNRISGNRVAIGINAPKEVPIVRGELDRVDAVSEPQGTKREASQGRKSEAGSVAGLSTLMSPASVSIASRASS